MSRARVLVFGLAVAAACAALRGFGHAQSASRIVRQLIAPPAIDRGVSPLAPADPNTLKKLAARRLGAASAVVDRTGRSGAKYVAGRVIVKFKSGVSSPLRAAMVSRVGPSGAVLTQPSYADFNVVKFDPLADAEAVAEAFAARPDVEYAQAAYRIYPSFVPNDPLYLQYQWNFPAIDLERAWDIQPGGTSSIIAAVLDTGIAFQNRIITFLAPAFTLDGVAYPALGVIDVPFAAASQLGASSRYVAPHDFIWDDDLPLDLLGHGTHVAGTIGQLTNDGIGTAGIAFNVRLMPVKVIDSDWDILFGAPNEGTDETVARGLRYAADNGAKVINMSIGRNGPPAPAIEDAVKYAVSKGAFVSIAAGNEFEDGNPTEVLAEIASRVQGAVSVGATDRAHNRAYYSSTGSYLELSAPGGSARGFGASGVVFQQTFDPDFAEIFLPPPAQYRAPRFDVFQYVGFQGTSMAAPHVTGLAALLAQQGYTTPAAIEAALERFATDRGAPGRDVEFGFGEINARNTLRGLGLAK